MCRAALNSQSNIPFLSFLCRFAFSPIFLKERYFIPTIAFILVGSVCVLWSPRFSYPRPQLAVWDDSGLSLVSGESGQSSCYRNLFSWWRTVSISWSWWTRVAFGKLIDDYIIIKVLPLSEILELFQAVCWQKSDLKEIKYKTLLKIFIKE